jgi:hypothetical protein
VHAAQDQRALFWKEDGHLSQIDIFIHGAISMTIKDYYRTAPWVKSMPVAYDQCQKDHSGSLFEFEAS